MATDMMDMQPPVYRRRRKRETEPLFTPYVHISFSILCVLVKFIVSEIVHNKNLRLK